MHAERERIANKVAEGLAKDSEYTGARNDVEVHLIGMMLNVRK